MRDIVQREMTRGAGVLRSAASLEATRVRVDAVAQNLSRTARTAAAEELRNLTTCARRHPGHRAGSRGEPRRPHPGGLPRAVGRREAAAGGERCLRSRSGPEGCWRPRRAPRPTGSIRSLTRLITRAWFRRVESVGMERLPDDRPLVVVANHANGFVDPVLLLALSPRPLRFLAKSTLWKVPGVKWVLAFAGVLPVHRAQDAGGTKGNLSVFAAVERELSHDAAIALFPEGTVNDELRLQAAEDRRGPHRPRGPRRRGALADDRAGRPRLRRQDATADRRAGASRRADRPRRGGAEVLRARRCQKDPRTTRPSTGSPRSSPAGWRPPRRTTTEASSSACWPSRRACTTGRQTPIPPVSSR